MLQSSPHCPPAGFELLVLMLALAAVALGLVTPLAHPIATARSLVLNVSSRHIAETLLEIRG